MAVKTRTNNKKDPNQRRKELEALVAERKRAEEELRVLRDDMGGDSNTTTSKNKKRSTPNSAGVASKKAKIPQRGRGNPKNDSEYDTSDEDEDEEDEDQLCKKTPKGGTWAVVKNKREGGFLVDDLKDNQWKHCKFVANDAQKHALMERLVMSTIKRDDLMALSPEQRYIQIESYLSVYGSDVMTALNGHRNNLQQAIKKSYNKMRDAGHKVTVKDMYLAAQRYKIEVLPEKSSKGKKILKNIKINKDNAKYRRNFDLYNEYICAAGNGHSWKEIHFVRIPLGGDPEKGLFSPISADCEAMYIAILFNCMWKWELQRNLTADGRFPAGHELAGKVAKRNHFQCPYTSSAMGSCQLGGWNKAGRDKFKTVRKYIRAGRDREGVLEAEYESAARLYKKYGWDKKEKPSKKKGGGIDLAGAVVAFGDEEAENEEVVGVDNGDSACEGAVVAVDSDAEAKKSEGESEDDETAEKSAPNNGENDQQEEEEEEPAVKTKVTGARDPNNDKDENLYQVGEDGNFLQDAEGYLILFEDDDETKGEDDK